MPQTKGQVTKVIDAHPVSPQYTTMLVTRGRLQQWLSNIFIHEKLF